MRDIRFLLKPHYSNSRALIVGIDKYKNASPLSFAVSDAEGIRDLLINHLGFPEDNVTYLADSKATRQKILKSFMRFAADDIGLDDRVMVFFAGHGHTRTGFRGEVGYLVPYDGNMKDVSTLIRWDEFTRNAEMIAAKHILFVMDACYGGLALTRTSQPGSARFLKDMMRRLSRQVLTAGKADEAVSDSGGPLPNHSVFTGHLIEGLRGKAAVDHGVITANGLMAYVYNRVANDANSNQTPHYGYFDGDGDFIIVAPQLEALNEDETKDIDELMVITFADEEQSQETIKHKTSRVKKLLSDDSSAIELHDFAIEEVRRFLAKSSEDHFSSVGPFSKDELIERVSKYEEAVIDLSAITAWISYWARPIHKQILQKILSRSTDRPERQGGPVAWGRLRWYPLIIEMYCSGIAAIEGQRYDSLANIFFTRLTPSDDRPEPEVFVECIAKAMLQLTQADVFKQLPGHESYFTPLNEYLFKRLQPTLDDILFIGKNYDRSFDEFELFLALVIADMERQKRGQVWGPVGRFAWKHHKLDNPPLSRLLEEARAAGGNWAPLKAGFFGGFPQRFMEVGEEYQEFISKLNRFGL